MESTNGGMKKKSDDRDIDKTETRNKEIDLRNFTELELEKVEQMIRQYKDLVSKDPANAIQHITMEGPLLRDLLNNADGIRLISAADENYKQTIIMQFMKGDRISFYDINEFFRSEMTILKGKRPVCPPPPDCQLTLTSW